jgi:hypothetical protein
MKYIDCRTQADLDAALKEAGAVPRCIGDGWFEARNSSHVVAWDSSHVEARDSSHVEAGPYVPVTKQRGHDGKLKGGVLIKIPRIKTPAEWCAFHGVKVARGVATLYKAVDDQYLSSRGFAYTPGSVPVAPDWDGGKAECGGGLHFCADPLTAKYRFMTNATKFLACPVRLKDIAVHADASYPEKVKAKGCCAPCVRGGRLPESDHRPVGRMRRLRDAGARTGDTPRDGADPGRGDRPADPLGRRGDRAVRRARTEGPVIRHLLSYLFCRHRVTDEWMTDYLRSECRQGWDGPRWRFPKERIGA